MNALRRRTLGRIVDQLEILKAQLEDALEDETEARDNIPRDCRSPRSTRRRTRPATICRQPSTAWRRPSPPSRRRGTDPSIPAAPPQ